MLLDAYRELLNLQHFFAAGGWVLYVMFVVSFVLMLLIIERMAFRFISFPRLSMQMQEALMQTSHQWKKAGLLCEWDLSLHAFLPLIKTLIVICPMVGLLGTVTGMIQVFDSLSVYGTGNPRMMASGVAKATLPTMTGMAIALVSMLFFHRLNRWANRESQRLECVAFGGEQ